MKQDDSRHGFSLCIAIPARFASTRLPGKPLLKIGQHSLIAHVVNRAFLLKNTLLSLFSEAQIDIVVATDDNRIFIEATDRGAIAVMTPPDVANGSERIFFALETLSQKRKEFLSLDLVLNLQGDEPLFCVEGVKNLICLMWKNRDVPLGTLAFSRCEKELFFSSAVVKVTRDCNGHALYFSRAPIPYHRSQLGASGAQWLSGAQQTEGAFCFLHHVGVYAFRSSSLRQFVLGSLPRALEHLEGLEQLRALEAGWKILVSDALVAPCGVDTPEDLERVRKTLC